MASPNKEEVRNAFRQLVPNSTRKADRIFHGLHFGTEVLSIAQFSRSAQKDQIPGGLADERSSGEFDQDQLAMGIDVEMEHTDDASLAEEIATDHLVEDPKYYTHLKEMEDKYSKKGQVISGEQVRDAFVLFEEGYTEEEVKQILREEGQAQGMEDEIVEEAKRLMKTSSLNLNQAIEKAKSLAEQGQLSQSDYQMIIEQVVSEDRYPFSMALIERDISVRTGAVNVVEDPASDDFCNPESLSWETEYPVSELVQNQNDQNDRHPYHLDRHSSKLMKELTAIFSDVRTACEDKEDNAVSYLERWRQKTDLERAKELLNGLDKGHIDEAIKSFDEKDYEGVQAYVDKALETIRKEGKLVQKINKNTDKKEWALVSKKDPGKILKWFGTEKPSKEEVNKEEARVHSFSGSKKLAQNSWAISNWPQASLDKLGLILYDFTEYLKEADRRDEDEVYDGLYKYVSDLRDLEYKLGEFAHFIVGIRAHSSVSMKEALRKTPTEDLKNFPPEGKRMNESYSNENLFEDADMKLGDYYQSPGPIDSIKGDDDPKVKTYTPQVLRRI